MKRFPVPGGTSVSSGHAHGGGGGCCCGGGPQRSHVALAAMTLWLLAVCYVAVQVATTSPAPAAQPPPGSLGGRASDGSSSSACVAAASAAAAWLAEGADKDVGVCVEGGGPLPPELTCALPKAFKSNGTLCRVQYSALPLTLKHYEMEREVEARVLRLPEGVVSLVKGSIMKTLLAQPREVLQHQDGASYYAAMVGPNKLALDPALSCRIEEEVSPDAGRPPIWLMMHVEDEPSPFVSRAKRYAVKHGYGFLVPGKGCRVPPGLPHSWMKLALLRQAMLQDSRPGNDGWILWLDPYALITNLDFRVEHFLTSEASKRALLLVGSDAQPPVLVNVGVMLARKSRAGAVLIDSIWRTGVMTGYAREDAPYWDQNAIIYLLDKAMRRREFSYWLEALRVLPHRSISSFMRSGASRDLTNGHWRRGDFIALLTGVVRSEALAQAQLLLRDEGTDQGDHYWWLDHNTPYDFPSNPWTPFFYAYPIDTYFPMTKPNFLSFPKRTENTGSATPINPTCLWTSDEEATLFCVVRTINYYLDLETGHYDWPARGNSVNLFFTLSREQILEQEGSTIVVPEPLEMFVPLTVQGKLRRTMTEGFEDVKLIRYKGQTYGVCTNLQMSAKGNCEIVLLTLNEHRVAEATPMRGFKPNDCHKNWMAFELDDALHYVETVDPLTVVTPDLATGHISPLYIDDHKRFEGLRLRGTSAGLKFADGYLFVVHETVSRGQEYASRFMYLAGGSKFPIRKLSKPFFIVRKTVEFLIGIMMPKDQTRMILCFGFEDAVPAFSTLTIGSPKEFLEREYFWM